MIDYREIKEAHDNVDGEYIRKYDVGIVKTLIACRNELCEKCGRYQEAHLGACKDCRWRDEV